MAERNDQAVRDVGETERGLGRRQFMQNAAAAGIVVVGSTYLTPTLKLAGSTRLASTASAPPKRVRGEDDTRSQSKHEEN